MKLYLKILLAINLLFFVACNNDEGNRVSESKSNSNYQIEIAIPDSAVTLSSIISIGEWTIGDRGVLCLSETTDNIFYSIDLNNFQTLDSFGVRGQGPDEYLYPHVIKSNNKNALIAETMLRAFHKLDGKDRETLVCPVERLSLNDPNEIRYPIIGCYELSRDKKQEPVKIWRSIDVSKGETIDSLVFYDSDIPLKVSGSHLRSSVYGEHIVFIRPYIDEYVIVELDGTGKVTDATKYIGDKEPSIDCPCYSDVVCGKKYFYLLSNKNISYGNDKTGYSSNPSGKSEIEIIDYKGNPVAKLRLDIYGWKMLLDEDRSRILLLSADDDDIHIVPLNSYI